MQLADFVSKFDGKRIAVIGDVMLDRFLIGDTSRISPEAPVPVVHIAEEFSVPGGAGNVCTNIVSLGGKATLFSRVGRDASGKCLRGLLSRSGVDARSVIISERIATIEKNRLMARGQHVVRFDREHRSAMTRAEESSVMSLFRAFIPKCDAVIVSDYAKGCLTPALSKSIITIAKQRRIPVLVDTKPQNIGYFTGASVIAPNTHEALEMAGVGDINAAGRILRRRLGASILVTRGAEGMSLFEGSFIHHIRSEAREVFDVVGAGDTVMSTLALSLASGATLLQSVNIANLAAGIVVGKRGTSTVTSGELRAALMAS